MDWIIYYDGGTTFTSLDGHPNQAPGVGVLVIAEYDPECGRRLIHGKDYFVWKDSHWLEVDRVGLFDYLFCQSGYKVALAGRIVSNAEFDKVYQRAYHDDRLPAKTAHSYGERVR